MMIQETQADTRAQLDRMDQRADARHRDVIQAIQALQGSRGKSGEADHVMVAIERLHHDGAHRRQGLRLCEACAPCE